MKKFVKIFVAALVLNTAALSAQGHEEHGEHAGHEGHNHHLSVFLGMTSIPASSVNGFTVGADYEYRLPFANRLLGIGVLADFAFPTDTTMTVLAGFIGIHPFEGLKLLVAPGYEMVTVTTAHGSHSHSGFMLRGSVGYDIMFGSFSVTPIVSVDYVLDTKAVAYVYGIAAGIGF